MDRDQVLRVVVTVSERDTTPAPGVVEPVPFERSVQVYFWDAANERDCAAVRPVERAVTSDAVATEALRALFAGPTREEQAAGAGGFGPETDGLLRSVRIEDGTAYVDLDAARFPGAATTSCGGSIFLSTVTATLTQFPTVDDVVLALDGDPRELVERMQMSCEEPVGPVDPCDPAPFVSPGPP